MEVRDFVTDFLEVIHEEGTQAAGNKATRQVSQSEMSRETSGVQTGASELRLDNDDDVYDAAAVICISESK